MFTQELRFAALGHPYSLSSNERIAVHRCCRCSSASFALLHTRTPTLAEATSLFVLLCISSSAFTSSILGMHLFGGEFCTIQAFNVTSRTDFALKCRCCACAESEMLRNQPDFKRVRCVEQRKNFDTLTSALMTVFQVSLE